MVVSVPIVDTADATIVDGRRVVELPPRVVPREGCTGIDRERRAIPTAVVDGSSARVCRSTGRQTNDSAS